MKRVVTTPPVDIAVRTLRPEEVRQVHAWFTHLANWDSDTFVQDSSLPLTDVPGVFMLRTSTDIRIFFTLNDDTITILDVAKRQSLEATGGTRETR